MTARATLLAALLMCTASATAAEITRVESSFEPNDPFGMSLQASFSRLWHRGKIVRENYQGDTNVDVNEMRYELIDTRLNVDLRLGLYKDFEFHFGLPIVFQQDRGWAFAKGTNSENSTITNNCLTPQGGLVSAAAAPGSSHACQTPQPLFDVGDGQRSYRSGIGDLTFGLAVAVLNQKKDDTKPTWVLSFDYIAPIAQAIDPTKTTSANSRGPIGDKVHRYRFTTSISKRIGWADPYFSLSYTLPWRAGGFYSNCDNASDGRMAMPGNCGVPGWARDATGIQPPHVGGFLFGSEFVFFENPTKHQKVAIDLRGTANYVSEGRYYNELSDLFGKYLYNSDYFELGGQFGFVGQAAEFITFKFSGSSTYQTEHLLTYETIGKDLSGNKTVDITDRPDEVSPNFDYRIDRAGRRFRLVESLQWRINVQVSFNF